MAYDYINLIELLQVFCKKGKKSFFVCVHIYQLLFECEGWWEDKETTVFRISLDSGEVPSLWRQANPLPIFKKGDKMLPFITDQSV